MVSYTACLSSKEPTAPPNGNLTGALEYLAAHRDTAWRSPSVGHCDTVWESPSSASTLRVKNERGASGHLDLLVFDAEASLAPPRVPRDLLRFLPEESRASRVDAVAVFDDAFNEHYSYVEELGLEFRILASTPCLSVDRDLVEHTMEALMALALEAAAPGSRVEVLVREGGTPEIAMAFDDAWMTSPELPISARVSAKLAACRADVEARGGTLTITRAPLGVEVRVALPPAEVASSDEALAA
jgi:hypothetical protein